MRNCIGKRADSSLISVSSLNFCALEVLEGDKERTCLTRADIFLLSAMGYGGDAVLERSNPAQVVPKENMVSGEIIEVGEYRREERLHLCEYLSYALIWCGAQTSVTLTALAVLLVLVLS